MVLVLYLNRSKSLSAFSEYIYKLYGLARLVRFEAKMRVEMCIHNYIYYRLSDEDEKRNSSVIHDVFPLCHDSESGVKLFYLYFLLLSSTVLSFQPPSFTRRISE